MSASRTTLLAATGLALIVSAASGAGAQRLSLPYPYPANDTPLTLSSGTIVRTRDLVVFRGHNVSALTIVIQTPTPASDTSRVASQALEVANLHATFARSQKLDRIIVQVCRTPACIEMRERAGEMFEFSRAADGTWTVDARRGR